MFAAAGKTRDRPAQAADSWEFLATIRTAIDEPRDVSSRWKRQIVTAVLVGDSQVYTGLLPFGAVRRNSPPADAKLGENMCELMPQGEIDFIRMLYEPRI